MDATNMLANTLYFLTILLQTSKNTRYISVTEFKHFSQNEQRSALKNQCEMKI